MITGKDDDATSSREDSFLGELVPQVAEHLASIGQGSLGVVTDCAGARFRGWCLVAV